MPYESKLIAIDCNNSQYGSEDSDVYAIDITAQHSQPPDGFCRGGDRYTGLTQNAENDDFGNNLMSRQGFCSRE